MEINCLRCGKCCYFWNGETLQKCKHLVRLPNQKTCCRIYKKRLGSVIGFVRGCAYICIEREKDTRLFPNCPYNALIENKGDVKEHGFRKNAELE